MLLLFIDFRKAFDLVDAILLLLKLFHYGLDNNSLNLISDYFSNRHQVVKINNIKSNQCPLRLGVPQGSVLGPLFFLIFINDLQWKFPQLNCILFADDTTFFMTGEAYDQLIQSFCEQIIRCRNGVRFHYDAYIF